MDKRTAIKNMLNNMINDKPEQAALDMHNYLTIKMREVSGLASDTSAVQDTSTDPEIDD